jgi:membrane protein DedA with SNARE-associated domain
MLTAILTFLLLHKYVALFVVAFVAAFLLPIPASTMLVAAGGFASQGFLSFPAVLLVTLVANVLGDLTGFYIAHRWGEPVLKKIGFGKILRSKKFHELKSYILEFPHSLIYFSRFLTEVGPTVNILSGIVQMPRRTFFIFDLLGEASYVLLYATAGYMLGTQWENNAAFLAKATGTLITLGLIVMLIQLALYQRRKGRK